MCGAGDAALVSGDGRFLMQGRPFQSLFFYFDCIYPAKPPQLVGGKNRLQPNRLW